MNNADDPIPTRTPEDTISSRDAIDVVYRVLNPDWQNLEERLSHPISKHSDTLHDGDEKVRADREAWRIYDEAQREANEWLRERIARGDLDALIIDPDSKQVFKLDRHTGISSDLFGLHEFWSRPNKIIKVPRPVFFERKSFDNFVKEIIQPDEVGRDNTSATATSKDLPELQQQTQRIYRQLFPDGDKGRAKERNEAIVREFKRQGLTPPSVRTIQRALKSE